MLLPVVVGENTNNGGYDLTSPTDRTKNMINVINVETGYETSDIRHPTSDIVFQASAIIPYLEFSFKYSTGEKNNRTF